MNIQKDMKIGELLELSDLMAPILSRVGMHCIGCASAREETLEEAAAVHGINADLLVKQLNDFFSENI